MNYVNYSELQLLIQFQYQFHENIGSEIGILQLSFQTLHDNLI